MPIVSEQTITLLDRMLGETKVELESLVQPIFDMEKEVPLLRNRLSQREAQLATYLTRRKELEDLVVALEASVEDRG